MSFVHKVRVTRLLAIIGLVMWVASLFFPALLANDEVQDSGIIAAIGWLGPLAGGYLEWLANPVIIVAAIITCVGVKNRWVLTGILAPDIALIVCNGLLRDFPANEAGTYPIQAHYSGWFLWMAAQILVSLALIASLVNARRSMNVK